MEKGSQSRRQFLITAGLGSAALASGNYRSAVQRGSSRPNIILVMADDLGYECLSCNGSSSYQTPCLDELARTGIRFQHCYSQPLCTPSRVQLMTGQYNFRNYTEFGALHPGETTFGHILHNTGYATCVVGKWQLAARNEGIGTYPDQAGFDEHCLWQVDELGSRYWNPLIQTNGNLSQHRGRYGPDVVSDYLLDFIERHRLQPFFAYYPMILTHSPFMPTPDSNVPEDRRSERNVAHFPDMVAYADRIVGRIVHKLDQSGIRERTLILFTGDNGTHRNIVSAMGNLTIRGDKGRPTDAGTHVPLVANWHGTTPAGAVCEDLFDFTDFLPTFVELADATIPPGHPVDGRSMAPQLMGRKADPREWILCYYNPRWGQWQPSCYVRDKRWKLYQDGRLYDIPTDPGERNPIAAGSGGGEATAARKRLQSVLDSLAISLPETP